jgi:hypothetical protein
LNHDERFPDTRALSCRRRLLFDGRHEIRAYGLKRRDETKPESRNHGDHEVEAEDAGIGCCGESQTLLLGRCEKDQATGGQIAYEKSEKSSHQSEKEAFDEELLEDMPPTGSYRQPKGDLLTPVRRFRDQQIGRSIILGLSALARNWRPLLVVGLMLGLMAVPIALLFGSFYLSALNDGSGSSVLAFLILLLGPLFQLLLFGTQYLAFRDIFGLDATSDTGSKPSTDQLVA